MKVTGIAVLVTIGCHASKVCILYITIVIHKYLIKKITCGPSKAKIFYVRNSNRVTIRSNNAVGRSLQLHVVERMSIFLKREAREIPEKCQRKMKSANDNS